MIFQGSNQRITKMISILTNKLIKFQKLAGLKRGLITSVFCLRDR